MMFNHYDPTVHPLHHLVSGPLAVNTKILQYGTVSDQLGSKPLMDRLMTVLSLSFDSLQGGDRTPYNVAINDFMVDYNNRDDARVRPKPQHKDAWQSLEALMQFAIDVFGRHKPELMDQNPHVIFRPAVLHTSTYLCLLDLTRKGTLWILENVPELNLLFGKWKFFMCEFVAPGDFL